MRESELEEFPSSFGWEIAGTRPAADVVVAGLERVGFACHEKARSFLGEYFALKIDHLPALVITGSRISSWTNFDPSAVCTTRDADVASRCSEVAGTALFPIGVDSFHLTVYSGSDGRFYAGFDSSVYQYGQDRNVMFSMMKAGVRPILLGEWTLPGG
ncbi:SUKH-3 domain-containing protein [Streptomyces sp. BR123]|uniref:SUKH-3 domain-containing protein n=1 Tax=Streptomyces sp. BR123 TaxID=2749828 RepID=UPI0015C4D3B1|nr:SUKH-3 domain-containing protein [Streptomyces sp. BR123]NXY95197.1 SUKH-3 domain-containing protein [Streptomyces sp. BR123]